MNPRPSLSDIWFAAAVAVFCLLIGVFNVNEVGMFWWGVFDSSIGVVYALIAASLAYLRRLHRSR